MNAAVDNLMVRSPARYGVNDDQDWHDARARHNRSLQVADLLEVVEEVADQLLGARLIGADATEIGAALLKGIDAYLDRLADRSNDIDPDTAGHPPVDDAVRAVVAPRGLTPNPLASQARCPTQERCR